MTGQICPEATPSPAALMPVERVMRLTNAHIRDFAGPYETPDAVWEFFCECGCFTLVPLSLRAFDAQHGVVWAPGHEPRRSGADRA